MVPTTQGQTPGVMTVHHNRGSSGSRRQIPELKRANLIISCWNIKIEKARQRINLYSEVTLMAGVWKEGIKTPADELPRAALVSSVQAPLIPFINFQYGFQNCLLVPLKLVSIS